MTPPAVDVTVPAPPIQMARRIFVWTVGLSLIFLWGLSIHNHQDQWAIASVMGLLIFVYVTAASAEQVVQIASNAGVMKAVTAASSAVTTAADAAGAIIAKTTTTTTTATPAAAVHEAAAANPPGARDDLAQ